jgi:hypothetical protein
MHEHATDSAVELLVFIISDEDLEKAACGLICANHHPGTGVATICVPDAPFPKNGYSPTKLPVKYGARRDCDEYREAAGAFAQTTTG